MSNVHTQDSADALRLFALHGKTAVVTGAAQGIGRATALLFAAVGARVIIADLNGEKAREAAAQIGPADKVVGMRCDVTREEEVAALIVAAQDTFGPIDVLVNNAAYRPKAAFLTLTVEEWGRMHDVTLRGTFLCSREVIRSMVEQSRDGVVVNVSSVSAIHPTTSNNIHYDAAKSGVEGLTRGLAFEFGPKGIRVNAVRPGATATETVKTMRIPTSGRRGPLSTNERIALGERMGTPAEMAQAILFLASPAASYITGQTLAVDGGFLVS